MVRQGGSRVFFDVVGQMQAAKLISDAEEMSTVVQAIMLDAFDGIKGSLDGIFDSVGAAIEAVREPAMALGESRVYFEKFFDFEGVKQYEESIIDVGLAFGYTGAEALDAGARMAQLGGIFGSGAGIEAGTQMGTAFGIIGGMEAEEAQKRMISIAQQTGFLYEGIGEAAFKAADAETQRQIVIRNSLYMMDQLNTVESNSVATVQQISQVMDQFAASATAANMSIAEQAALSAVLVEKGETASKAGRGLKQMLVRIASDTGGAATALHEFGVATTDINGDMVGLTRIMQQLSDNGFHQLDSTQQQQLATSIAGSNHAERFMKIMTGQERVTELTTQAINREVGALEELERFTNSNTFAANQMAAAQENLSAKIGEHLLPAITDAERASLTLKGTFEQMLSPPEEGADGIGATIDGLVSTMTKGASRSLIMANAMYDIGGGAFEAFMNVQSLLISVKVYRAIMKQNVVLQQKINDGMLGQRSIMQTNNQLQHSYNNARGQHQFMQAISNGLDTTATNISKEQLTLMSSKERKLEVQNQIAAESLQFAQRENDAHLQRTRIMGMAATMDPATVDKRSTVLKRQITMESNKQAAIRNTMLLEGEQAMFGDVLAADALVASEQKQMSLNEEMFTIRQVQFAQRELQNTEVREAQVLGQEAQARIRSINQQRTQFIETLKLLKATGHLTKEEFNNTMAKLNNAAAGKTQQTQNMHTVGSLMRMEAATMKATFTTGRMTAATSLASMGLMMFSDSEDAMQASMILMVASMVPAIFQMGALGAATDKATASTIAYQAVATGGIALVAIGAALAGAYLLFDNHADKMEEKTEDMTAGFEEIQYAANDFAFELDKPGGVTDLMLDFGNTTAESMDKAEKSVQDFMSAREELFFGFSPSRMNQTLFEQLVNQGVGELYYRTELNIANNFFGLTVDEMVDQVTVQVQERLVQITGS